METKVLSTEEAEPPGTRTAVREAGDVAGMRTAIPPFAPYPRIIKRQVGQVPRFPISERSEAFRARFYPESTAAEWCDWRWQLRHRIRTLEELERIVQDLGLWGPVAIVGFQVLLIGLLADVISSNRKLIEDLLYRVRSLQDSSNRPPEP